MTTRLLVLALLLAPWPATAELQLPTGFITQIYVTGEGFDPGHRAHCQLPPEICPYLVGASDH